VSLQPGRKVAHYEILAPLGKGGMGEVYRARDGKLGRDVAIKALPEEYAGETERLRRFQREAKVLASLNHSNIASIYGLEESEGKHHLILELVEGETLAERISRGPIPADEALRIVRQIAEALEEAHGRGVIHRDLKPANVKLTPDGKVKVLDFGLAKTFAEKAPEAGATLPTLPEQVTREGVIMGTAAYMSPEQARGQDIDERTDVWALGCVLWECLTGRKAFGGATLSDSIAAILHAEPDWNRLPADTPPHLRRLLRRCLNKDPRQRLHHVADARIEVEEPDPPRPDGERVSARYRIAFGVLALALVGVGAVALWSLRRPAADPSGVRVQNPLAGARFTRVTDFPGAELGAALSPDGRFVAFVSDHEGHPDAFVGQIGIGEFRNITRGLVGFQVQGFRTFVRQLGFSRDGSEIWLAGGPGSPRMRLVPLLGGATRSFLGENVINVDWSPDGQSIVYFENTEANEGDLIYVADRNGTNPQLILDSATVAHQHFPVWSVDGRWIYLVRGGSATSLEMDLWRVRPDGGDLERLTRGKLDVRYPTPLDERTVLYSARDGDGAGPWLWVVDVETKVSRRASVGLEQYSSVAASADRRRLVATVQQARARLWSVPILDRLATESDASPFGDLPTARALAPRFGGSSLFFLSSRGSGDGLWRYEDGQLAEIWRGGETALLEPAAVSPDGETVAVLLRQADGRHLHVLSADGAQLRELSKDVDGRGAADWSPDGRWVVTGGSDEAGVVGLYKIPVDGGAPERIADGVATDPVWSPDGSLIVYAGRQAGGPFSPLMAVRPDGQPVEFPPIQVPKPGEGMRFLPDGSGLIYLKANLFSGDFWLLELATMKERRLTRLDPTATTRTFDITPDGQRIVFDRLSQDSDIVLIELGGAATGRRGVSQAE
jgi:Tol biopolymer transport system component